MPGTSASDKDTNPLTTANPSSLCRFRAELRETFWGLYFTSVLQPTKVTRCVSHLYDRFACLSQGYLGFNTTK